MASTRAHAGSGYSAVDYTDFAHTGPGTLAGQYLRRFWQPAYVAADLPPGHAKPIQVMGVDYTLYRGEDGAPHPLDFRCAHRGTQLSTGWIEGDCIRCFYHGWKYDPTGQCVEQPAEDASFAGWRVPVDDTHHRAFSVVLAHVTGEAAERYREVQGQRQARPAEVPAFHDLAEQVLRGERRVQDGEDHPSLVLFQDTVAQVGQGTIADRQRERLGRSDVAVMLLRRLWTRELRALAEGRPLKDWRTAEALVTTSGV
jgi:nitrite reductase/ring-hydroxylating ferredoxin subunit